MYKDMFEAYNRKHTPFTIRYRLSNEGVLDIFLPLDFDDQSETERLQATFDFGQIMAHIQLQNIKYKLQVEKV